MSIFEENISAVNRRFPGFKKDILEAFSPAEGLEVLPTPSGSPTAQFGGLFLHSRHDPVREARRLAEGSAGGADCFVLEGFGLGYTAEALLEAAPGIPLIVVEPDPSLFLSILSARPVGQVFSHPGVSLLIDSDPEALVSLLSTAGYTCVKVVRHRALSRLYEDYFDRTEKALSSYLARRDVNRNTLRRFGKTWVRNLVKNLDVMARAGGTDRLTGLFNGMPALLLAAGPSVEELLPHLEELRRRFLLAAVDTSARLLWERGIDPDILVVVDPQYWNTRHLDRVHLQHTILVSESSTHPRVFRTLDLPVFFGGSIFPLGRFLEGFTRISGKLGAGGSVATSAWDILRRAGCSEICCGGLDLGFPEMRTHYRGSFFDTLQLSSGNRLLPAETGAYHALRNAGPFYEDNYSGGKTLTDRRLIIYKWWFEGQFRSHPDPPTYGLSKGGIRIEGMAFTPVERLLSYPPRREEIDRRIDGLLKEYKHTDGNTGGVLRGVEELLSALAGLEELSLQGLATVRRAEEKHRRGEAISDELTLLDSIDNRVLSSSSRDLAGFLMQDLISEITASSGPEDGASPLKDTAVMYEQLKDAAEYHRRLLEEAAEGLRRG